MQRMLLGLMEKFLDAGPTEETRATAGTEFWGRAKAPDGGDYTAEYGGLIALIRVAGCCARILVMSYKYF